jgi:hypothetical protein
MTRKYQLPRCINKNSKIIDNFDFLNSGTQMIFSKEEEKKEGNQN